MIKTILLGILFTPIFLEATPPPSNLKDDGYNGAKWGMSKAEVENIVNDGRLTADSVFIALPGGTIYPNDKDVSVFSGAETQTDDDAKTTTTYGFYKDKFLCVSKTLTLSGTSWNVYLEAMKKKYGKDVQIKTRSWREERLDGDYNNVTVTYAVWGNKGVSLSKEPIPGGLGISVEYYSPSIFNEMRRDIKEAEKKVDIEKRSNEKNQLKKTLDTL